MKSSDDAAKWVKVGVKGFDGLLTNGIPKGKSVLVSGGCGTGKTIFCLQTIWHGLQQKEKCLYLSFEESAESLIQHMKDFGWDPTQHLKDGSLIIKRLDVSDLAMITRSMEGVAAKELGEISINIKDVSGLIPDGFSPDRVVIDSISALASVFRMESVGYRIFISQLFRHLEKIRATSFLISETEQNPTRYSREGVVEFLADGVFVLYSVRKGDSILNAIEIRKLRGTKHVKKIVPFFIESKKGITVLPRESVFVKGK